MIAAESIFEAVKVAVPLADYLHSQGIEPNWEHKIPCPWHDERTPSCHVYADSVHCFGCGKRGDVSDVAAALEGFPAPRDAARQLARRWAIATAGSAGVMANAIPKPKATRPELEPYRFTDADIETIRDNCERLALNFDLCGRIANARGWEAQTIRGCALDGDLGWTADGKLAFHYRHGIKVRWREGGERMIRWAVGGPHAETWRGSLLRIAPKVFICEGETDAITLIDAGCDEPGVSIVVALPSSGTMPRPEDFTGKHVVIVPDADKSGAESAAKLETLLRSHAAKLGVMPWNR